MADIMVMEIGDGGKDLTHDDGCLRLRYEFLLDYEIEKLASFAYLCHQIDGLFSLVDLVEFDDVRMVQFLE
jgi:hypothetical protein